MKRRVLFMIVLGLGVALAAAWPIYSWYRALPLRELPNVDLSTADPAVRAAIDESRAAVLAAPRSAAAWGNLGQFLEAHYYQPEALVCLAQAARLDPQEFLWAYLCGDLVAGQEPVKAENYFRAAARLRARSALPRLRLAELFLERRRLDEARQEYEAAIRIEPASARAMFGLGQVAFLQGDLPLARRWSEQSFDRDGGHRRSAALLLQVVHRLGDREAAARQQAVLDAMPAREVDWDDPFLEAVKLKRRDPDGMAATASELIDSGQLSEAVSVCERLVASDPDNVQWQSLLALALIKQKDYTGAERALQAALKRHSQSAELHFQRGVVHYFMEDWPVAEAEFRRAVDLKSDYRDARYNLGQTLIKLGDRDRAVLAFRETIRIRPDDAASSFQLGKLLLELGDRAAAREALGTAARLAPHDAAIRQALEDLRSAEQN